MSNKKEIAKIAREIKELKAELGKSSSPLAQNHLSPEDYQRAKKLKGFNKADWKWNSKTDLYDKV